MLLIVFDCSTLSAGTDVVWALGMEVWVLGME